MGPVRTEFVEFSLSDGLAKIALTLALLSVGIWLFMTILLPLILILVLLLIFMPALRWLVPLPFMAMGRGRRRDEPRDVELPITPLTVSTDAGVSVEVVLRGELRGGSPHLGDEVDVVGRTRRDGTVQASALLNRRTGARTTTRLHPAILRSRVRTFSSIAVILVCGVGLIPVLQTLLT